MSSLEISVNINLGDLASYMAHRLDFDELMSFVKDLDNKVEAWDFSDKLMDYSYNLLRMYSEDMLNDDHIDSEEFEDMLKKVTKWQEELSGIKERLEKRRTET